MSTTQVTQQDNTIDRFVVSAKRFVSKTEKDEDGNPVVDHWEAFLNLSQTPKGLVDVALLSTYPQNDGTWLTFRGETETEVRLAVKQYLEMYSAEYGGVDPSYVDTKMRRTWKMRTYKLDEPKDPGSDEVIHSLFEDEDDW
jgi:hypothetical protein